MHADGDRLRTAFPVGTNRVAWLALLDELGIDGSTSLGADLDTLATTIAEPGTYRGIVHGDPCPDNVRLVSDRLRVYDFEYASIGHVLLDAAYLSVPFPTCWCVASLPPSLVTHTNAAYRKRLGVVDEAAWHCEFALASPRGSWRRSRARSTRHTTSNPTWGITTIARERIAGRLGRFVDRTTAVDELRRSPRRCGRSATSSWTARHATTRCCTRVHVSPEPGERVAGPPDWWSETA